MNTALGITFTELGHDFLEATMPVDQNTVQPMRLLNGGASLALIECLGSMAANLTFDRNQFVAVGQAVTASHFKSAKEGESVTGRAVALHLGKSSQIWEVLIKNAADIPICKGTITMAVLTKPKDNGQ